MTEIKKDIGLVEGPQQQLSDIFRIDFEMNGLYPQMIAPKILAMGNLFLKFYIGNKLTFETFQEYMGTENEIEASKEGVKKHHKAHGKIDSGDNEITNSVIKILFLKTKIALENTLSVFFDNDTYLYEFLNDSENRAKIIEISKLFDAGEKVLRTDKWKCKSLELRNSLRPVLASGLDKLSESNLQELKPVWTSFSKGISEDVIDAVVKCRSSSTGLITDKEFSDFIEILNKSFEIEVNTRSDSKQY